MSHIKKHVSSISGSGAPSFASTPQLASQTLSAKKSNDAADSSTRLPSSTPIWPPFNPNTLQQTYP